MTTIYLEQWGLDAMADKDHPPIGGVVRAYVHAAPGAGRVAFVPADVETVVQAEPGALRVVAEKLVAWIDKYPSSRVYSYDEIGNIAAQIDAIGSEARAALAAAPAPAAVQPVPAGEWCAEWLRNNYQDHQTIASLCDAMRAAHLAQKEKA